MRILWLMVGVVALQQVAFGQLPSTVAVHPIQTTDSAGGFHPSAATLDDRGNLVTPGSVSAQSVNGVLDATKFPGTDIGAKVNAAAATCKRDGACRIAIPPGGELTFQTTIEFVPNMTLECTRAGSAGEYAVDASAASAAALRYTGNGTAVDFKGSASATLKGCSFDAGTASTVVQVSGSNARVEDIYINGGVIRSKLIHVTAGASGAKITGANLFNFQGDAIYVDGSLDTYIGDVRAYAYKDSRSHLPNATSRSLVIDSGTGGVTVQNFKGGASGLHGLVIQSTIAGQNAPTWIWLDDFESDCSNGDGWVFDASLKTASIGFTATKSWAAGAGLNCDAGGVVNKLANGIRISGGSSIHLTAGSFIRSNAANGVLIEGDHADIEIADSSIYSNNVAGNAMAYGVYVPGHVSHLKIQGDTITDNVEGGGNQQYGIDVADAGDADVIVTGNTLGGNVAGPLKVPCVAGFITANNTNGRNAVPNCLGGSIANSDASGQLQMTLQNLSAAPSSNKAVGMLALGMDTQGTVKDVGSAGWFNTDENYVGDRYVIQTRSADRVLPFITFGDPVAPTNSCAAGTWSATQDGKLSFCRNGRWEAVIAAP